MISSEIVPRCWSIDAAAATKAAIALFMSLAPRPISRPSSIVGRERIGAPALARRDDVEMAGEAEMRRARAADRDQILDRPVGRLADHEAVDGEAERLERCLEHVEHRAGRGRDAGTGDEL